MSAVVLPAPTAEPRRLSDETFWGIVLIVPYFAVFALFVVFPVLYGIWLGSSPSAYRKLFQDPVFFTTITCLPVGIYLLVGAIAGHGRYVRRARIAFFIAAGITLLVVTFLVVQHIANNNDGKVFGIQIGFRVDHRDGREM